MSSERHISSGRCLSLPRSAGSVGCKIGCLAAYSRLFWSKFSSSSSQVGSELYREANKGLYVLVSRTQARPGRTVKQEQEEISRNHAQTFIYPSVQKCRKIHGLGCLNRACARARVTQPSPHIFLHICSDMDRTNSILVLIGSKCTCVHLSAFCSCPTLGRRKN